MPYFLAEKKIHRHIDGLSKAIPFLYNALCFRSSSNVKSKREEVLANQKPDKLVDLTHNKMPSGSLFPM